MSKVQLKRGKRTLSNLTIDELDEIIAAAISEKNIKNAKPYKTKVAPRHIIDTQQQAYETGLNISSVSGWLNLYTEMLANDIIRVVDAHIFMQALPDTWQDLMRIYLETIQDRTSQRIDEQIWGNIGRLRDTVADARELHDQIGPRPADPDFLFEQGLIQIADDIRGGVRDLLEKNEPAALYEALQRYETSNMRARIEHIRDNRPRLGRKPGADPVTQFILDETNRLAQLHDLKTANQKLKALYQELKHHELVQAWIENPERVKIKKYPIEVQAFERVRDMIGDDLRQMQKNARRRGG